MKKRKKWGLSIIQRGNRIQYRCAVCGVVFFEHPTEFSVNFNWERMAWKCACGNVITRTVMVKQVIPLISGAYRMEESGEET